MQENLILKKKEEIAKISNFKIDVKIFNKNGKIESNKILNLSSFLKK